MRILSHNQLRLAGAMAVLAAGLMLSPLSAMANYSSTPDGVATPCDTCYMGAGLAGTQNKAPAAVPQTPRCDSCTKGS